jgi:hypothetical protein
MGMARQTLWWLCATALGDLNGNGFVDAFVVSGRPAGRDTAQTPNTVWFNDGQGASVTAANGWGKWRA